MPPRIEMEDSDVESDDINTFEDGRAEFDAEAKEQLNGELKVKADDVTGDDGEEEDYSDVGDIVHGEEDEDEEDGDDNDEGEGQYNVEAIRDHQTIRGKVHYHIKWLGYPESENTWEPKEHLLPHAKAILEAYVKKTDMQKPGTVKKSKSKQSLRRQTSTEDSPASTPAAKRRKRNGAAGTAVTAAAATSDEDDLSTWLPAKEDWENLVVKVEAIDKDDAGQLMAFILFKNGKRSRVSMDMVYRHCPRPMLRFYEQHLKFS